MFYLTVNHELLFMMELRYQIPQKLQGNYHLYNNIFDK